MKSTQNSPSSRQSPRWGLLGAGKMATALSLGMIKAGVANPASLIAFDPLTSAAEAFAQATGAKQAANNGEVVQNADVLIIAVKPGIVPAVLDEVRALIEPRHSVLSIAAGVSLKLLEISLGGSPRVVRAMPNTPALIGEGAACYALGHYTGPEDEQIAQACLGSVGQAWRTPEYLLDAVTGLSGSGPAFVYAIIEALSDGGVLMGLPRDLATALAAQTLVGAAKMVQQSGSHPGFLKDQVTSPGGTTIAGLHALEKGGLRATLMDAVQAATKRSAQLA